MYDVVNDQAAVIVGAFLQNVIMNRQFIFLFCPHITKTPTTATYEG